MRYLWALAVPFMLGSLPTGWLVARLRTHEDIRCQGSGSTGATNVARVLGLPLGLLTLFIDLLKGAMALLIALHTLPQGPQWHAMVVCTVVLGHVFSPFLLFRGGKGVAVFAGSLLLLDPWAGLLFALTFLAVTLTVRRISPASLAATALTCLFTLTQRLEPQAFWVCLAGLIILVRHRDNLRRLLAGREPRFSFHHLHREERS